MLRCWWSGHKALELNALNKQPLISVRSQWDVIVKVELCARCKYLYWTGDLTQDKIPLQPEQQLIQKPQRLLEDKTGGKPDGERWN